MSEKILIIQTPDGKKKLELTEDEFNYMTNLILIYKDKKKEELRRVFVSRNGKLFMN